MIHPFAFALAVVLVAVVATRTRRRKPAPLLAAPLALLGVVGLLHNPGHIVPGLDGILETQRKQAVLTGATVQHDFVFVFDGAFAGSETGHLVVLPTVWIQAKTAGSASAAAGTLVPWVFQVIPTATGCTVRATLGVAPGGVETTTVACSIVVAGKAER